MNVLCVRNSYIAWIIEAPEILADRFVEILLILIILQIKDFKTGTLFIDFVIVNK